MPVLAVAELKSKPDTDRIARISASTKLGYSLNNRIGSIDIAKKVNSHGWQSDFRIGKDGLGRQKS